MFWGGCISFMIAPKTNFFVPKIGVDLVAYMLKLLILKFWDLYTIIWGMKHSCKLGNLFWLPNCFFFFLIHLCFSLGLLPAWLPESFHRIVSSENLSPTAGLAIPLCAYLKHAQGCQGNGGWADMPAVGRYISGTPTLFYHLI